MKRNYIFLSISLFLIITTAYILSTDTKNEFILKTESEIEEMGQIKDSTFILAEEIVKDVNNQKREDSTKMNSLDSMVRKKQNTIEQQVVELKILLKKSNEMKELAEVSRTRSMEMENMSKMQKMVAERERQIVLSELDSVLRVNIYLNEIIEKNSLEIKYLTEETAKLKDLINTLTSKNKKPNYSEETDSVDKKRKKGI